ncbi:hypothetical protein I79_016791 [Cricetulus griseus]|uniref:Uncharacterized protein n=1 Tax=Cricetulus griseus TaxID=10029 RepID=G3I0B2_CRIGR|nr:hypothetical protein I79_016791 [Cricetulus griseus]
MLLSCISAHQKRAPDLITDSCEPPFDCWELNSGPLEEQSVLLTSEPSLQPLHVQFLTVPVRLQSKSFGKKMRESRLHTCNPNTEMGLPILRQKLTEGLSPAWATKRNLSHRKKERKKREIEGRH